MNGIKFKSIALLLALILLTPQLCACTEERNYPPALPQSTATPPPSENEAQAFFETALYFVSEDGRKLYPEEHTLFYSMGTSRAQAAINGLLAGPDSALLQPSVPAELYLEHVELSLDVCNVYFTGAFPGQMRAWLTTRAAIAATVYAAEGISCVNVFYNGQEPGYDGRPLGSISPISDALDVYLNNMEQDFEVIPNQSQGEAVAYETHAATIYFADTSKTLIVARTTELTYAVNASETDIVNLIFNKLRAGDSGEYSLEPVLPADISIQGAPEFYHYGYRDEDGTFTPTGADATPSPSSAWETPVATQTPSVSPPVPQDAEKVYILDLVLSYGALGAGVDETLMCAALTMTFTSYIPGLDGVRVSILQADGSERALCADYFERSDFRRIIGDGVPLFYPDEEGLTLLAATRIVPGAYSYDPAHRLRELLYSSPADPGVAYPGFTADDVLDVYLSGATAVVNWKEGFAEKLRRIIEDEELSSSIPTHRRELMFVYGVIDTLTELPYIERVWMLENGQKLETISELYLGNPLVRSPGLISED